jgi:hypothetical protein
VKTCPQRGPTLVALLAFAVGSTFAGVSRADPAAPPPPPPALSEPRPAEPPPPAAQPAPPPQTSHGKTAAFVTGGLAIGAAAAGAVLGVIALGDKSDFEKHPTYDKANAGNDNAAYCDAALGAALVLAATSIILFITRDETPATAARAPALTASPIVTAHGAGAGAILRF